MLSELAPKPAHILFLFSDTGGGHRSAAEAVIEALKLEYGEQITCEMVDVFKQYAPRPLNRVPDLYPTMVKAPQAWGLGYRLSNGRRRARLIQNTAWPYIRNAIRRLVDSHPGDMIVSVHPLATSPVLRALGPGRPPFITIVTDLVTTHALWYDRRTDLTIVPTDEAYRRGLRNHMKPEQMQVVGLPVADRFCRPSGDRAELRARLGWPSDRPMLVLVGGGEGMGPLEKIARAVAENCPRAGLAVVCGRNQSLKERLDAHSWPIPTFIYGFVREMPDFMRAADILLTKAGPGTISEALNASLPIILYSRLPGQEDGNVTFVLEEGAGVWADTPDQIVAAVNHWLEIPEARAAAAANCRRVARPDAARRIAHILVERLFVSASS